MDRWDGRGGEREREREREIGWIDGRGYGRMDGWMDGVNDMNDVFERGVYIYIYG